MFNENLSAEATPSQILIIENDSDQMPKWKDLLKQADPSISFVWAYSEAEAREILFDSFMNDSKFDLIISKEEFSELNWRLDVQKALMIVTDEWSSDILGKAGIGHN